MRHTADPRPQQLPAAPAETLGRARSSRTTEPHAETELAPQTDADAVADTDADADADVDIDAAADVDIDAAADVDIDAAVDTDVDADPDADLDPDGDTQSASSASPGTAPDVHDTNWSGCPTGFQRAR
ncbi:MAG: hypothetical protein IPG04_36340 [Polyangiaceae bacterium]|nr:hypothetical protein [Polyangiaceae bacterium]